MKEIAREIFKFNDKLLKGERLQWYQPGVWPATACFYLPLRLIYVSLVRFVVGQINRFVFALSQSLLRVL